VFCENEHGTLNTSERASNSSRLQIANIRSLFAAVYTNSDFTNFDPE